MTRTLAFIYPELDVAKYLYVDVDCRCRWSPTLFKGSCYFNMQKVPYYFRRSLCNLNVQAGLFIIVTANLVTLNPVKLCNL